MSKIALTLLLIAVAACSSCSRANAVPPVLVHFHVYNVVDTAAAAAKEQVMVARMAALTRAVDVAKVAGSDPTAAVVAAAAAFDRPGGPLAALIVLIAAKDAYGAALLTISDLEHASYVEVRAALAKALAAYEALRQALPGANLPAIPPEVALLTKG